MAIGNPQHKSQAEGKLRRLCPNLWQSAAAGTTSSSSSSVQINHNQKLKQNHFVPKCVVSETRSSNPLSSVARSLLPPRRRLLLDPKHNLYFTNEPGKQVKSAVRIKNKTSSDVAFKFQTTAPKSCYMRPPGGILGPGESLIATVYKFLEDTENNEKRLHQKCKDKFKIMSLKVKAGIDYAPELFDEEKDQVVVERILRVVFLDVGRPSPALEKLNRQLAEADAALEVRKKPTPEKGPQVAGRGLVIDEWKERREKYLARQRVEAVDSI